MHLLSQKKLTITAYFPYASAFLPLIVISYSHIGVGTGFGTGAEVDLGLGVEVGSGTGMDSGCWAGAGDSYWGRSASNVLASNSGAGLPPDSAKSRVVLRVVGVYRFCSRSAGGRSRKSVRSGNFSNGIGLPRKKRFRLSKRTLISARMVSILVE